MALLSTQQIVNISAGSLVPTYGAANGGGDSFVPGNNVFFHCKNGGSGTVTLTFVTPATYAGLSVLDPAISIANGSEKMIGPFPPAQFEDFSAGTCSVSYSGVTSVTVGVFQLQVPAGA